MTRGSFLCLLALTYEKTKAKGAYHGTATSNAGEFWAEGVQTWFHCNTAGLVLRIDKKRKPLLTRKDMTTHLPEFARLLEATFSGNTWVYSPISERATMKHLKGHDPAMSPTFTWPKRVNDAFRAEEEKRRARKMGSR